MSRHHFLPRLATAAQGLSILWLAVCPVLGMTAAVPVSLPINEGESEEEQKSSEVRSATEWVAPNRADRRLAEPAPPYLARLPLTTPSVPFPSSHLRPAAADPFANGLGSPYRC